MRLFGWFLFAVFGGIIVYLVAKKPSSTGTQHLATITPSKSVAPTTNNITGTVAGVAKAGNNLANLINSLFPPSSVLQGDSISQDATAASIASADGSGNIGDFPGIVDTNPNLAISSIYDTGIGIAPTLVSQDTILVDSILPEIDTSRTSDISLYS